MWRIYFIRWQRGIYQIPNRKQLLRAVYTGHLPAGRFATLLGACYFYTDLFHFGKEPKISWCCRRSFFFRVSGQSLLLAL